ncbi:MAG: hypothetical protein LBD87_02545, partial [Prevotellaceae bacterium]|nr:hypothetical protein [Prevotellaceae bacterium]
MEMWLAPADVKMWRCGDVKMWLTRQQLSTFNFQLHRSPFTVYRAQRFYRAKRIYRPKGFYRAAHNAADSSTTLRSARNDVLITVDRSPFTVYRAQRFYR